jgi:hypothetical protein
MKESFGPRNTVFSPSRIYKPAHPLLNRFAIAIILAGMSLLALPTEAKIVYARVHAKIGIGGAQSHVINLENTGATVIIQFQTGTTKCSTSCPFGVAFYQFIESPASGNGVVGSPPAALNQGDRRCPSILRRKWNVSGARCPESSEGSKVCQPPDKPKIPLCLRVLPTPNV